MILIRSYVSERLVGCFKFLFRGLKLYIYFQIPNPNLIMNLYDKLGPRAYGDGILYQDHIISLVYNSASDVVVFTGWFFNGLFLGVLRLGE